MLLTSMLKTMSSSITSKLILIIRNNVIKRVDSDDIIDKANVIDKTNVVGKANTRALQLKKA